MKATVYIAVTVDGFIAAPDGSVGFLDVYQKASEEDGDMGFSVFLSTVDLIVMGRKTWDQVVSFGEEVWPYGDRNVYIWSRQDPSQVHIPQCRKGQAKVINLSSPGEILAYASEGGHKHAYIDGGRTIQEFLRHGCVREFILTRVPLMLGSGIPLFAPNANKLELDHLNTRAYSNGLVQTHYRAKVTDP